MTKFRFFFRKILYLAAVASANSAFTASETALTLASTATVDAAVVTAASIQVANEAVLNAQADLATTSVLLLKSNAELKVAAGTTVSAAGLVLESANQVQVASDGVLRCGTIVVGKGKSTIEGSVSMVDKKVVEIASEGQLVLTSAAASTQATVDAALAVQAQAEVLVENSVRLASAARVTGEGALNVAGALALSSENAVRVGTLTVAESGKLQIDAATSVVAEATNKAELAGEAVITAGANVEQVVIKHASRTGEFDKVTVNGQVAATAGASAGRKRAEEAWETTYGEKETTITRTQSNTAAVLLSNIGILMISMVTFINTLLL